MSDDLQHYGVKGMKWGVRRFQPYPKGSKNAGKFVDSAKRKAGEVKQKTKQKIGKAKSSINTKRKAASKKASVKRKAYHKKKKPESIYGRAYDQAKRSGASETKAMKSARATEVITKAYMAKTVASAAMTALDNKSYYKTGANVATNARKAAYLGKELSKVAGKQALNSKKAHDAVRFGKNIMQAAKRSPVRYVDGAAMKNVVNVGTDLMKR